MTDPWRLEWVKERLSIVAALLSARGYRAYPEAVLIAGAAISALAAERWPGPRIDHVRFVELLVAAVPDDATRISIPLLLATLERMRLHEQLKLLRSQLPSVGRSLVVSGVDVDRTESEVLAVCPTIDRQLLREHSYVDLLYTEVRSPYVHEYQGGGRAGSVPMTEQEVDVSYVNRLRNDGTSGRLIHFHPQLFAKLAQTAAAYCDAHANELPARRPLRWWIKGSDEAAAREAKLIDGWRRTAQEARLNPEAAQDLLREFTEGVALSSGGPRDVIVPRPHAEYISEALRQVLENDADPGRALGLRQSSAGRPRGAGLTHDPVALSAAYWLAVRRGRGPEEAKEALRLAVGADRRTVERAAQQCSAFEDPERIDEPLLLAILREHSNLTATLPAVDAAEIPPIPTAD